MLEAFDYIINRTQGNIDFIEYEWVTGEDYAPDLFVVCEDKQENNGFVGLEGWYDVTEGTTIINGSTIFYYNGQHCVGRRPVEEIAMVLYNFGLEYASRGEVNNIMNPLRCNAEITDEDLDYLNKIYG